MSEIVNVEYKEVHEAISLIEQFELLAENLEQFSASLPTKYKLEGQTYAQNLNTLLAALDTDEADQFDNLAEGKLSGVKTSSIIERLGVSQELIRLRKNGKTIAELSLTFNLSSGAISRFFRYFDKLKPIEKSKLQKRSIFNTIDELEELAIIIKRNIARLEGQDDEVNSRLISELRQTIVAAANLSEKMANQDRYQKFTQAVIRVLVDELPSKRTTILKEIQSAHGLSSNAGLLGQG